MGKDHRFARLARRPRGGQLFGAKPALLCANMFVPRSIATISRQLKFTKAREIFRQDADEQTSGARAPLVLVLI